MKIIEHFDSNNYNDCTTTFSRIAVRAILFIEHKLVMVTSNKFDEYKFPGGGQKDLESDIDTLIRETKEETGLSIIKESIKPYGYAIEKRRSVFDPSQIFHMESRYYLCECNNHFEETNYDDYEIEYGYQVSLIDLDEAIKKNIIAAEKHQQIATWINRELAVLRDIKNTLVGEK